MLTILVCFLAGLGAGLGTGFAGMSAAAVITPVLVTFLKMDAYEAVGIALASDVLASSYSAYEYGRNKNLDIRNGLVMMVTVLLFTMVGSWVSSLVSNEAMGGASVFMTMILGIKFIVKPVMTTKEAMGDTTYDRDNDGHKDREIVPVLLSEKTIAYLDLPIGASLLKEFFDVRLTIINNAASEFSMLDNVVTLNVPEGLSIVEASGSESSATVEIDEIPGQTSTTISWILRGDEEGEYSLSADYSGLLSEFNEPIYTTFLSKEPIQVYGLSAIKLIAEVNSSVNFDAFYFNLAMENVSSVDVNMPSVEIENHVLTSYLNRVFEFYDENGVSTGYTDPTIAEPTVRHLNTILYGMGRGTNTCIHSFRYLTERTLKNRHSNESYIVITPPLSGESAACVKKLEAAVGNSVCVLTAKEEATA